MQPVTLDIVSLFAPRWTVTSVVETTLTATRAMLDARTAQYRWHQEQQQLHEHHNKQIHETNVKENGYQVTLLPMDIKTFTLSIG